MLENPRLKYCFNAHFFEDGNVLLSSEKENVLLTDKRYSHVLSRIRYKGVAPDVLAEELAGTLSLLDVYYILESLEKSGYITEESPEIPPETCAYWNSLDVDVNTLFQVLRENTVTIHATDSNTRDAFQKAFAETGIQTGNSGVLNVYLTDDYLDDCFFQINKDALSEGRPWMLVKTVGTELWIGPIFLPGQTGCWECLKQRLELNRPLESFCKTHDKNGIKPQVPGGNVFATRQMAAHLVSLEIARWLYKNEGHLLNGSILSVDTQQFSTAYHRLTRLPHCKACGTPPNTSGFDPTPIVLKRKNPIIKTTAGGYREIASREVLEKYRHHVSPITGIMPYLRPYHPIEGAPVYSYSSGRNIAMRSKTMFWLNQHLRSFNGGKGRSWEQAETGALAEAIERYCVMYHGDEPYITSSLEKLGTTGIHPNDCMNFSEEQFKNRDEANRDSTAFYSLVPVPFDPSQEMHWTPVFSLTRQRFKYLPSCFCYAQYPAQDESRLYSYPDSNGAAAGNSMEEAILQGLLELIERDGVALWWYNMLPKSPVDLCTFNEPYFEQLLQYYHSLNRSLYVLDLTTDLQIPIFAAISHCLNDPREKIIFGFGSHVDAAIGIERALVELNQILPIVHGDGNGGGNRAYLTRDKNFVHWLDTATIKNKPYLAPREDIPIKRACDYPQLCEADIYDALMFCLKKTEEQGLETLVLDMTRKEIGLNVVKVMVPGLRHFWKRRASGRLYDVPVKMGWRGTPLKEEETNPIGLFI